MMIRLVSILSRQYLYSSESGKAFSNKSVIPLRSLSVVSKVYSSRTTFLSLPSFRVFLLLDETSTFHVFSYGCFIDSPEYLAIHKSQLNRSITRRQVIQVNTPFSERTGNNRIRASVKMAAPACSDPLISGPKITSIFSLSFVELSKNERIAPFTPLDGIKGKSVYFSRAIARSIAPTESPPPTCTPVSAYINMISDFVYIVIYLPLNM